MRLRLLGMLLTSALGVIASVRAEVPALIIMTNDNGKTLSALVQQPIQVRLPSNPSTGYTWLITSTNGNSVVPSGESAYTPDPGGATGSGGTLMIPLLGVQAGVTMLSFSYVRPWAPTDIAGTFTVTIDVGEQSVGPRLSLALRGTNVLVAWPRSIPNSYYLEGTRASWTNWAALNALPIPDGTNYTVALPAIGERLFFRLRQ